MILLSEEECRAILENPGVNHRQMARWFYEHAPGEIAAPDAALRRVLTTEPMTDRTRLRISLAVMNHFEDIGKAYRKITSDADEVIL